MHVLHKSSGFRECDGLTLTIRGFAIPRSATRVKRNTMQSGHIVRSDSNDDNDDNDDDDDKKERGLLFPPLSAALARALSRFCSGSHRIKHLTMLPQRCLPLEIQRVRSRKKFIGHFYLQLHRLSFYKSNYSSVMLQRRISHGSTFSVKLLINIIIIARERLLMKVADEATKYWRQSNARGNFMRLDDKKPQKQEIFKSFVIFITKIGCILNDLAALPHYYNMVTNYMIQSCN